jgi:high frequency lysogenization protein
VSRFTDQTLALASMFQSASLINQLAHGESINQAAFDCSLDSLFTLEASSTQEIFGHGEGLIQGLRTLIAYQSGQERNPERMIAYYVLSMIRLANRLLKDNAMVSAVHEGLIDIERQMKNFDLSVQTRLHRVDGLYQRTISEIKPRIIVQGDQVHLTRDDSTTRIRTLLFAGIRAAVLWKQLGGSRFRLIFGRKKTVAEAQRILRQFS